MQRNCASGDAQHCCTYMSGDWSVLTDAHTPFGTILMSETIYNTNNYAALHRLLVACAAPTANM